MNFKKGDKVRFKGSFLHNTGQFTGPEGQTVFTVVGVGRIFLIVDEPFVGYENIFTPEEVEKDPTLKLRRIHPVNVELCK